jgi:hypothetical protein
MPPRGNSNEFGQQAIRLRAVFIAITRARSAIPKG